MERASLDNTPSVKVFRSFFLELNRIFHLSYVCHMIIFGSDSLRVISYNCYITSLMLKIKYSNKCMYKKFNNINKILKV